MEVESAIRGEVFDIWPPGAAKPWRLLFDGDTLESLREFNSGTQRSEAYLQPQQLLPIKESSQQGKLSDHIPDGTIWFFDGEEASPPTPLPSGEGRPPRNGVVGEASKVIHYFVLPPAGAIDAGAKSTTGLAAGIAMAAKESQQR